MKIIPLSQGYETIIDDNDYDLVTQYSWHVIFKNANKIPYAQNRIWNKELKKYENWSLHRWLLRPPKNMDIDHINGNSLDNRRSNLQVVPRSMNIFNKAPYHKSKRSSQYRGVCWDKSRNKWSAHICRQGKQKTIGRYDNEKDAALAYNKEAIKLYGFVAKRHLNVVN